MGEQQTLKKIIIMPASTR